MPKGKKKYQIIDLSLPMTGKATKDRKYYNVEWANGEKSRILRAVVEEKQGVLWIDSAKKAELSGLIRETEAKIAKVRRDLRRDPRDTVKRLTIFTWRKYLSGLKAGMAKIDKQERLHKFVESRICQKV